MKMWYNIDTTKGNNPYIKGDIFMNELTNAKVARLMTDRARAEAVEAHISVAMFYVKEFILSEVTEAANNGHYELTLHAVADSNFHKVSDYIVGILLELGYDVEYHDKKLQIKW